MGVWLMCEYSLAVLLVYYIIIEVFIKNYLVVVWQFSRYTDDD